MSASQSENAAAAAANKGGEFGSSVSPSGPQTTQGHQPGQLSSSKDHIPESNATVFPAGSAPTSKTHQPNPDAQDGPGVGAAVAAQDSLPGATSAEVHDGLGHPGAGMSSQEMHHDGQQGRKKAPGGLQGVGAKAATSEDQYDSSRVDMTTSVPGATKKMGSEAVAGDEDRSM